MHCKYNCNVQKMSNSEGVNECTNYIINVMMMQIRGGTLECPPDQELMLLSVVTKDNNWIKTRSKQNATQIDIQFGQGYCSSAFLTSSWPVSVPGMRGRL